MKLQRKSFHAYQVKADEAQEGVVEAIVAVFNNVDHGKERIRPGAFGKSLQRRMPKGVWCHDWTAPVAKTLEALELSAGDPRLPEEIRNLGGLYVKAQFNLETQRGREAYSDLKFGTIDEFSIGYWVLADHRGDDGVRDLLELDLAEWSPVLSGMNPATQLLAVKGRGEQLFVERKAQYLGEYAEASMTMAALRELTDRLFWYALYDAVYDSEVPLADRRALLDAALGEYVTLIIRAYDALMAGQADESPELAAKAIRELWSEPKRLETKAQPGEGEPAERETESETKSQSRRALARFLAFEARCKGVPV